MKQIHLNPFFALLLFFVPFFSGFFMSRMEGLPLFIATFIVSVFFFILIFLKMEQKVNEDIKNE